MYSFLQLASQILSSLSKENNGPYASNWLERLRQIKRIQNKVIKLESGGQSSGSEPASAGRSQVAAAGGSIGGTMMTGGRSKVHMSDFTEYT